MTQGYNDDAIIALYKASATEQPAKTVDAAILNYAQTALATKNQAANAPIPLHAKPTVTQRKVWWPVVGLAASVAMVTLLAPWRWVDPFDSMEVESDVIFSAPTAPVPVVETSEILADDAAPQELRSKAQSAPVAEFNAPVVNAMPNEIAESINMPERTEQELINAEIIGRTNAIYILLANGETDTALQEIEALIAKFPDAEPDLPQEFKRLLDEAKGDK
uniref:hypothetical protein n=1 Tax=Thaumasiovibrio occultus TaxID=1891184 RepID=UPI000B353D32|nr:hypothetical protein [Thaumasiovibrio occultus]